MRNASARREAGSRSKPDSVMSIAVPPAVSLQPELNQRRRLDRVVDVGIHGTGMPAIGEVALGLDLLDQDLQGDVLVAWDGEPAENGGTRGKGAVELHPEPGAELLGVGDGPPDTGASWRLPRSAFRSGRWSGVRRFSRSYGGLLLLFGQWFRKRATFTLHIIRHYSGIRNSFVAFRWRLRTFSPRR